MTTLINSSSLSEKNSSPSSLSSHNIFHDNHHHPYSIPLHNQQKGGNDFNSGSGSYNIQYDSENESGLKFSIWKEQVIMNSTNENQHEEISNGGFRVKWMSSKMRLMHKMRSNNSDPTATNEARLMKRDFEEEKNDQDLLSFDQMGDSNTSIISSSSNNTTIRVCSDCNTTKTPLWRSGPCGPKSLCNACGIRQRKARRAMIAASTATTTTTNGTLVSVTERSPALINFSKSKQKEKRERNELKYKKRCKIASTTSYSRKELRFEEFLMNLSQKLSLHRMFPQDEKEAAILLMSLSCGNIHG